MFVIEKDVILKISDPTKRGLIVKEYLETKKNIRDNLLSERTGDHKLQTDLSKFLKTYYRNAKSYNEGDYGRI